MWGTYCRRSTLIEPHIHPPFDVTAYSPDWLKRMIPKSVMVGVLYLLGIAFVTGACLGIYDAVVRGSCSWPASS